MITTKDKSLNIYDYENSSKKRKFPKDKLNVHSFKMTQNNREKYVDVHKNIIKTRMKPQFMIITLFIHHYIITDH